MSQPGFSFNFQENKPAVSSSPSARLNFMPGNSPPATTQTVRTPERVRHRDVFTAVEKDHDTDLHEKFAQFALPLSAVSNSSQPRSRNGSESIALGLSENEYSTQGLPCELFQHFRNNDLSRHPEQGQSAISISADQHFRIGGCDTLSPAYCQNAVGSFPRDSHLFFHGGDAQSPQQPHQQGAGRSPVFTGINSAVPPSSNDTGHTLDPALRNGQHPSQTSAREHQQTGWDPAPGNRGTAHSAPSPGRVGPATQSMLSSYATASAQPQLFSKPTSQSGTGSTSLQASYGSYVDDRSSRGVDRPHYSPSSHSNYPIPPPQHSPSYGMHAPPQSHYLSAQPYRPARPMSCQQAPMTEMGGYYGTGAVAAHPPVQPDLIFQVQFKRIIKCFMNRSGYHIGGGDFVVVEGDRGEDLGVVISVLTLQEFAHKRRYDLRTAANNPTLGYIIRLASMQERDQLPDKYNTEQNVVRSCNELAMPGFGLPIMVYDAEFQFDRQKLTIYYECNVRIDFRDFVRQLHSTYHARIWMKIGSMQTPIDAQPLAVMALATGVHFSGGNQVA